jgi:hypothetical protein
MNLFGTKKKSTQAQAAANVNPVDTIRKLRDNLETLDKREAHIYKKVEAALLEAKQKAAKKDKKGLCQRSNIFEAFIISYLSDYYETNRFKSLI